MEKVRGFEIAKGFEDKGINLPIRKTKYSAGYDIEAAEDCIVPAFKPGQAPTLIKTGLKSYMADDEYLMLCNRSSNPKKKGLILANSVGIVDADYYGNPDNDGHIMFAFFNVKDEDIEIKKALRGFFSCRITLSVTASPCQLLAAARSRHVIHSHADASLPKGRAK